DKIGEIIGPGGKNIRGLIEQANQLGAGEVDIDIADDGRVTVTAVNQEQRDFVVNKISGMTAEPEIGKIYDGVIDSVMPYGAFVDVTGNISGLIHVSELADGFVKDPNDVVKTGDKVRVKLIKVERGKQSFSIKQAKEGTSSESEE